MSYVNTLVDKVYVINLDKDKERLETISRSLNREKIDYERIPATVGSEVGWDSRFSFLCNTFCTDGIKGCALSHHRAWEHMLKNGYSRILVLEDDAIIPDGFDEKVRRVMSRLPDDYEVVFLGCRFFNNNNTAVQAIANKAMGTDPEPFDDDIKQVIGSMGSHGILYTRTFVEKIINEPITTHIDIQIQRWVQQFGAKSYGVDPEVIDTRAEEETSNISESFPPLANTVLRNVNFIENVPLSWTLSANHFKILGFNVNLYIIFLFLMAAVLPYWASGLLAAWILTEALVAGSTTNGFRYGLFLVLGLAVKVFFENLKEGFDDLKRTTRQRSRK